MFKSLLAMILKNEENLITLITILDVDKRNRRKWGVINWRLQQLGIQCRAHFWIDISWNGSIFCRVAFMTNCLLNLFCLIQFGLALSPELIIESQGHWRIHKSVWPLQNKRITTNKISQLLSQQRQRRYWGGHWSRGMRRTFKNATSPLCENFSITRAV